MIKTIEIVNFSDFAFHFRILIIVFIYLTNDCFRYNTSGFFQRLFAKVSFYTLIIIRFF